MSRWDVKPPSQGNEWWTVVHNGIERESFRHEHRARSFIEQRQALAKRLHEARRRHAAYGARPRDSQRSKVYEAERAALHPRPDNATMSLEEAQALVNRVLRRPPADPDLRQSARLKLLKTKVVAGRCGGFASAAGGTIRLGVWARQRAVVLHEAAHCLCRSDERHGRNFARVFLKVVRRFWSADAYRALRLAYDQHGVKYRRRNSNAVCRTLTPAQLAGLAKGRALMQERRAAAFPSPVPERQP